MSKGIRWDNLKNVYSLYKNCLPVLQNEGFSEQPNIMYSVTVLLLFLCLSFHVYLVLYEITNYYYYYICNNRLVYSSQTY